MAAESKNADTVLGGIVLLVMMVTLYSCFFEEDSGPTQAAPTSVGAAETSQPTEPVSTQPQFEQAKDAVAGLINLNGHLCADIVDVKPLQVRDNVFEVTCIEYRGGSGRVRYLVDGQKGLASRL
jgi:hypothetical protein